jgi:hypothetical protein
MAGSITFRVQEENVVTLFDRKIKKTGFNRTEALVELMKAVITGNITFKKGASYNAS